MERSDMTKDFEYFKKKLAQNVAEIKAGKLEPNRLLDGILEEIGLDGKEFEEAQKMVIIANYEIYK
jgi:hypothetical protein